LRLPYSAIPSDADGSRLEQRPQRILRLEMKFVKINRVAQILTVRRQPAGCLDCLTAKLRSQNLTFQALIFESVSKREKGF
jgi:hypothetical protein